MATMAGAKAVVVPTTPQVRNSFVQVSFLASMGKDVRIDGLE
jgi:hypothetical protein